MICVRYEVACCIEHHDLTPTKKISLLVLTLICIRWRDFISRDLGNVEYLFSASIPRFTLMRKGRKYKGSIYWSNRSV